MLAALRSWDHRLQILSATSFLVNAEEQAQKRPRSMNSILHLISTPMGVGSLAAVPLLTSKSSVQGVL